MPVGKEVRILSELLLRIPLHEPLHDIFIGRFIAWVVLPIKLDKRVQGAGVNDGGAENWFVL